jgi:hypothetical protein
MTDSSGGSPKGVPADAVSALEDLSPEQLRAIAEYATALAERRADGPSDTAEHDSDEGLTLSARSDRSTPETSAHSQSESSGSKTNLDRPETTSDRPDTDTRDRPDDPPDGVPAKATLTEKEINDNRYYYWQWRDGDTIRSKYVRPVNSSE